MLHPYQMVKDLRTQYETSNTAAVLDGDLDAFMQAELERVATPDGDEAATRRPATGRADDRDQRRADGCRRAAGITFRPAVEADLPECGRIQREGIDAYLVPLGFPPLPRDNQGLLRLHAHTPGHEPGPVPRRGAAQAARPVADRGLRLGGRSRAAVVPVDAVRRAGRAGARARHGAAGRASSPRERDGRVLATCTDSAQPISNGLYASLGIVPAHAAVQPGRAARPTSLGPAPLPDGVTASASRSRRERLLDADQQAELDALRSLDSSAWRIPQDHAFDPASEPRLAFAYRDGSGGLVGYGYTGEVGRIGPIAVADAALLAPVLGHLLTAVVPRGASAVWLPGAADEAFATAIRAGLRIEGFPILAVLVAAVRGLHQIRTNVTGPDLIGSIVAFRNRVLGSRRARSPCSRPESSTMAARRRPATDRRAADPGADADPDTQARRRLVRRAPPAATRTRTARTAATPTAAGRCSS